MNEDIDNKNIFNINSKDQQGGITAGIVNINSSPKRSVVFQEEISKDAAIGEKFKQTFRICTTQSFKSLKKILLIQPKIQTQAYVVTSVCSSMVAGASEAPNGTYDDIIFTFSTNEKIGNQKVVFAIE